MKQKYSGSSLTDKEDQSCAPTGQSTPLSSQKLGTSLKSRYIRQKISGSQLSVWTLPELSQVILDLEAYGGKVKEFVEGISEAPDQDSLLLQIYLQLEQPDNEQYKQQWQTLQRARMMSSLTLSLDKCLADLRAGEPKSVANLEFILKTLFPKEEVTGDDKMKSEYEKLKAHVEALMGEG